MYKNNKKGFTIVELVVVIAVIAILAAVLIPTFSNLIKRANVSSDTQLIHNLNTALVSDSAVNGKHTTMQSALDAAEKFGYDVSKINASATQNEILWDSKNDVFCYFNDETKAVEYIPETTLTTTLNKSSNEYWCIIKATTEDISCGKDGMDWSCYLASSEEKDLTTSTGIDVGKTTVTSITYTNSGSAKTVVIRTNSASTNIVLNPYVDSANSDKGDHITFYGKAGQITGLNNEGFTVAFNSFEIAAGAEVPYIKVAKGHIENKGTIDLIYATSADVEVTNTGSIDHAHAPSKTAATDLNTSEKNVNVTWDYNANVEQNDIPDVYHHVAEGTPVEGNKGVTGTTAWANEAGIEAAAQEIINESRAPEIAEEVAEDTTAVVYNLTSGVYYDNLYSAIEEVPANKKTTLVLLKNITGVSNENYQIAENQIIVFDLNGHTMNTVAPDGNTAYAIENKGTLTIKDNSDTLKNGTGKGKLEMNALNPDLQAIPSYGSYLIDNKGTLTVESGWLHNASSDGLAAFAINTASNSSNVNLVINGGRVTSYASLSIRQYLFTEYTNKVAINAGVIGSYWIQNSGNSTTSANGNLNINGGEFLKALRFDTGYSIDDEYDIKAENVYVNIYGGTFNGEITIYENGNNGHFTIFGGMFNKVINYYGELEFISGGTFNVSPTILKSDGYPYATKDGGGYGFYNLNKLLEDAGTTLENILSLDLETQLSTYGFGLEYWEQPSLANIARGGSACYDVVRYVAPSYDEYIMNGFIGIDNGDQTLTVKKVKVGDILTEEQMDSLFFAYGYDYGDAYENVMGVSSDCKNFYIYGDPSYTKADFEKNGFLVIPVEVEGYENYYYIYKLGIGLDIQENANGTYTVIAKTAN